MLETDRNSVQRGQKIATPASGSSRQHGFLIWQRVADPRRLDRFLRQLQSKTGRQLAGQL